MLRAMEKGAIFSHDCKKGTRPNENNFLVDVENRFDIWGLRQHTSEGFFKSHGHKYSLPYLL